MQMTANPFTPANKIFLNNQFEKYQEMRPLFEKLQKAILKWDNSVDFVTRKT